eukprot:TRINITY_DN14262_c0_g1_i1.p1 TRINITY_DN14262_c0_g1~~TRINITY_DN14262_c0_g1_i1.p1  ORF type:complete len:1026 (+),score=214.71 TRINITY_DN14262_c0_g1_i1:23-3100(+)
MATMWEVVGGAERGGLRVCLERDLASGVAEGRLATGAVLKELDFHGGRLHYELVSGSGPASGWVSTSLRGKDLIVKQGERKEQVGATLSPFARWAQVAASSKESDVASLNSSVSGQVNDAQEREKALMSFEVTEEEMEALREYEEKFGATRDGSRRCFDRKAFSWFDPCPRKKETPAEAVKAVLAYKGNAESHLAKENHKQKQWDVDSEGEDIPICSRCSMPVGEFAYPGGPGKEKCVHSECMAQVMVEVARQEEEARVRQENAKKTQSRLDYDIGWRAETVPKNCAIAQRLGCSPVPQGLCCLVYDEAAKTVQIAATHEPAAAVNLEYLLLALKVRKEQCREPLFSLDPVDVTNMTKTLQKKYYEPAWLAGTSVGDVMFQADYFLKELSLGEYTMPVVGMRSVFDWVEMIEPNDKEWAGREWFVVKNAEIRTTEDKTLIPHVKMGVEAREQKVTNSRLEDKPVTCPNHPLKRFADNFTRNFDLIAERKSVIFHLRELAKASVMAKFLVDSGARLDRRWHEVADEIISATKPEKYAEIPQLWNMRGNSRIELKDGQLVNMATGAKTHLQAIFGGVQFGLDKFQLSQRSGLQGTQMSQALQPMQQGAAPGSRQPMFMPQRFQLSQRGETPQGVDLNLDKFALLSPDSFAGTLPPCSAPLDSREARVTLGRAFLRSLRQESHSLKEEDRTLLKAVFNQALCDRIHDDDAFIPPDPNSDYINKVRNLVNEETMLLKRRKGMFAGKGFSVDNAGATFPSSWTSGFQIERDGHSKKATAAGKHGFVQVQVDAAFQKTLLDDVLPVAAPEFQKATEDGTLFRMYCIGSLEVRTTEELGGKESVEAVFSRSMPAWQLSSGEKAKEFREEEVVLKAKIYIEAMDAQRDICLSGAARPVGHFYVVLETAASNFIVTERLKNGSIAWAVNPDNLDDRNSLAKLLFTADSKSSMTLRDVRNAQVRNSGRLPANATSSASKSYAKTIFQLISGCGFRGKWGGCMRQRAGIQVPLRPSKPHDSDFLKGMWTARRIGRG